MAKKIYLTESQFKRIVDKIFLEESRSLKSQKLQDIFKEHGGLYKSSLSRGRHSRNFVSYDFHNMPDEDVVCVITRDQLIDIERKPDYTLRNFARDRGYEVEPGDEVESERLGDGNYLIYVARNAYFEHTNREGGFKDFFKKQEERRKNRDLGFQPTTNRGKAARDLRQNPYFWAHKHGEMRDPQSGWSNPERRKEAMDNARQGKDAWGYDAIDHYKEKGTE